MQLSFGSSEILTPYVFLKLHEKNLIQFKCYSFFKVLGMVHINTEKGSNHVLAKKGILLLVIYNY